MNITQSILYPFLLMGIVTARGEPNPFVTYPAPVHSYLKRIQEGRQTHGFDGSKNFNKWQGQAREALIELIGLRQMEKQLAGLKPKVVIGKADNSLEGFSRSLCSIETEPGVMVPFYLLVPKSADSRKPLPLFRPRREGSIRRRRTCRHRHPRLRLVSIFRP